MARVFVSYRRVGPDDRIAMALYRRLSDLGHDVFLDSERVRLGTQWPREIRGALERAEHVVALVSLAYLDSHNCVDEELVVAIQRELPIIPVHLAHVGTYPASVRDALVETQAFKWRGEDDTAALIEHVAGALPHPTTLVKGMLAFEQLDAAGFRELGRETEVEQCVAALAAPGVVVVHGVSGAGKTSFLRAGVLPRLPAGTWQLVTATAATRIDPSAAAGTARLFVVDQFEQMIVAAKDPGVVAAFEQPALDWLAAAPDRALVLVIRDEFRTSLEATFPRLTAAARNVVLFPLDPAHAAAALATLLDSARIEFQRAFLDGVTAALVDGVPVRVRPALLQLVAQHAIAAGHRFDAAVWADTPTQRRAFFERHVRTTVLDQLPAAIPRRAAARALRGLTAAELKSSPRTIAEVADDEQLSAAVVERVLDVAAAPHARVATAHLHGDVEHFELVHDLFAGAIHAVVKDEEARARGRKAFLITAAFLAVVSIAAVVAVVFWFRVEDARRAADEQRVLAERRARREQASKLAALAIRYKDESPGRALALAAEALAATEPDGATAEAMRAAYEALAATHGPALRGSTMADAVDSDTAVAISPDGRRAAVLDHTRTILVWELARPDSAPRRLSNPGVGSLVFTTDGNHLLGWSQRLWRWDLRDPTPRPASIGGTIDSAAISLDEGTLFTYDGSLQVRNLGDPDLAPRTIAIPPPDDRIDPRLVSPDGSWAAIAQEDLYLLVDTEAGAAQPLTKQELSKLVGDDETELVAVDDDGGLYVTVPSAPKYWIAKVAGPPDARRVITDDPSWDPRVFAADDGTPQWVQLPDGAWRLAPLPVSHYAVGRGWVGNREQLIRVRGGGALNKWTMFRDAATWSATDLLWRPFDLDPRGTVAVATTLDAAVVWPLAVDVIDGRRWTGTSPPAPAPLPPPSGCGDVAPPSDAVLTVSPDGRWAVVRRQTNPPRTEIWECTAAPRTVATRDEDLGSAFDAGSRKLVTWGNLGVRVWRLDDGGWTSAEVRGAPTVTTAAFSPDATWVAIANFGVWVAALDDGRAEPRAHQLAGARFGVNLVLDLVFRHDGRQLAARGERALMAWDIDVFETGGEPSLSVENPGPGLLAYGGDFLFLSSSAGEVRAVYPATSARLRDQARRHGGRNLSVEEWRNAFGSAPYRRTFPELPPHRSQMTLLLDRAGALARPARSAAYQQIATQLVPHADASQLRELCMRGISADVAAAVLPVCEQVSELLPEEPDELARVAEARILAGAPRATIVEAIERFVAMAERRDGVDGSIQVTEKKQWLEQLRAGADPRSLYQAPPYGP